MLPVGPASRPSPCVLRHTLSGHNSSVLAVAFTKNGKYILSGSQDKSLRLWNPQSGVLVKTYIGTHNYEVNDLLIAEDNSKFLSCGGDKHVFQTDVSTGAVIRRFMGHERKVNALVFGPQDDLVLSASHDKSVRIWDVRGQRPKAIQVLEEASDSVLCVDVAGHEIVTGSTDGVLRRYDIRMGQLIADKLGQPIGSLSFSRDKQCILASTLDSNIRLFDRDTGSDLVCYTGHTNKRFKVQSTLDPSNSYVVSGSEDHNIYFWDLVEGSILCSMEEHTGPVFCTRFCGDTFLTSGADGVIKIWDIDKSMFQHSGKRGLSHISAIGAGIKVDGLPSAFGKQSAQVRTKAQSLSIEPAFEPGEVPITIDDGVRKRGDRGNKRKRR